MSPAICEREAQTAAAAHSGTIDHEIAAHAQQCPACSDILLVSAFLRENAILADQERAVLPDARHIWQKARSRAKHQAVRLALRPIRFMKIVAIIAFAGSPWLRLLLPLGRGLTASWSRVFDFNPAFVPKLWPPAPSQAAILLAFGAATIFLGLSSWYMVRQE